MRNGDLPAGMNFDLTDEQVMLRDAAERYVREHYPFEERRRLAANETGFSQQHWQQYAELGWLGLNLPEDVGGLSCSLVETMLLMEQFGRGMVLEPIVSTAVLCAHLIDASGNPSARTALLPGLVRGELLLALADEEPESRDLRRLPLAAAERDGSGYRLRGFKTLAPDAASADRLIVTTTLKLPGAAPELALFVVDRKAAGLTIDAYPLVSGQRAADVRLDEVACDADDLLARGDAAQQALDQALDRARFACMAQSLGAIEACLDISSEYIKGRMQFGQALGKFQSLQHLMADMFVDAQDARSILYQALASMHAEPAQRSRAISAAKLVVGEAGHRVSASAIQLHGGYGTTDEYPVSHYYRLLFVLAQLYGDTQFHANRFAELNSLNP